MEKAEARPGARASPRLRRRRSSRARSQGAGAWTRAAEPLGRRSADFMRGYPYNTYEAAAGWLHRPWLTPPEGVAELDGDRGPRRRACARDSGPPIMLSGPKTDFPWGFTTVDISSPGPQEQFVPGGPNREERRRAVQVQPQRGRVDGQRHGRQHATCGTVRGRRHHFCSKRRQRQQDYSVEDPQGTAANATAAKDGVAPGQPRLPRPPSSGYRRAGRAGSLRGRPRPRPTATLQGRPELWTSITTLIGIYSQTAGST